MNEYRKNALYRTLVNADVLSGIGDSLYNIVFIIYASSVPSKTLAVSLASFATVIPALLSAITGTFADRTKSKTTSMILTHVFQGGLFIVLAMLIGLEKSFPLFLLLLLINIISDTAGSYGTSLTYPFLQHIVKSENLDSAMGLVSASDTTIQIIFQSLGAVLIVAMKYEYWLFGLINAATFLLAAFVLLKRNKQFQKVEEKIGDSEEVATENENPHSFFESLKKPISIIKENPLFLVIVIFAAAVNFFGSPLMSLINLSLLQYKGLLLGNYGTSVALFNITFSVGIIAGSLFMNDFLKNIRLFKLMVIFTFILAILGGVFLWHKSLILAVLFALIVGYLAGKINPRISAIFLQMIPDKYVSSSQGLLQMIALLAAPIGQVVFLTLANTVSVFAAWLGFTIGSIILLVLSIIFVAKFGYLETKYK